MPLRYSTSSTTSCLTISSEISGLILLELGDPGTWSGFGSVFSGWGGLRDGDPNLARLLEPIVPRVSNSRPCGWEKNLFNDGCLCFSFFPYFIIYGNGWFKNKNAPFLLFMNPLGKHRFSCARKTSAKFSIWTQGLRLTALLSLMQHTWVGFMLTPQMGQLNAFPKFLSLMAICMSLCFNHLKSF